MQSAARTSVPRPSWQNALARLADDSGAIAVEYGLIAALVALAILGTIAQLGESLVGLPLQSVVDALAGAIS
jgi:Flp pilus assembly pilin Flp